MEEQAQTIFDLAYALARDQDPVEHQEVLENRYVRIPHQPVTREKVHEIRKVLQREMEIVEKL